MTLPFVRSLLHDRFLHLLVLTGVLLSVWQPFHPAAWLTAIDWHTIVTLSGLMLLTKGVELSGYFDVVGRKMVRRFVTERQLALFLLLAAALLSTFLTNDVALFIVVPLTITLKKWCAIPINRLIIFEALAVNAGSLLTPIGNPQNILLWGRSGLSFTAFSWQMAPLALAMVLTLVALCWLLLSGKSAALPERRPYAALAAEAGRVLSGFLPYFSAGAGAPPGALGAGSAGGRLPGAGKKSGVQRRLDAAAGLYGDVH